jgi:predicted O-methyltransferase YrrM
VKTISHINQPLTELGYKFTQREVDSISDEEGDLLYALVRMTKPQLAIETGTGHAIATRRIGEALKANGEGFLISCDTEPEYCAEALKNTKGLPVDIRCTSGLATLSTFDALLTAGFIFIDAGDALNRLRELEMVIGRNLLASKGTLVIHDALNKNYKQLMDYMDSQRWDKLVFESLAGISVFRKP